MKNFDIPLAVIVYFITSTESGTFLCALKIHGEAKLNKNMEFHVRVEAEHVRE
jgi:hypothetical protein